MTTGVLRNPEFSTPHRRISPLAVVRRAILFLIMPVALLAVILLFFATAVPLVAALVLLLLGTGIVVAWWQAAHTPLRTMAAIGGLVLVLILTIAASQVFASTPPISTAGSIATMEPVELNGSQQWITIRGQSVDNPVLLFLAGGPGGSELVMTRKYLGELEAHFTIVNWDQPGTGKSFNAVDFDALTPERYVSDAHALTLYLRDRFQQQKIYVFGESWGSILGIWLVQKYPDLYHAFISTGQMVDPVETDIRMYEFAIELLSEQGRLDEVAQLRKNGRPPYEGSELIGKFGAMNDILNSYMHAHAHGEGTNHNLLFDSLRAQEYGLLDKVNWLRGLINTFPAVYPQLYGTDLRTQATQLEVPAYFIKGRWDVNADNGLLEEYFALLEAPHKELIWFEDSAHTPMWDEPAHFVDVMVNTVLNDTAQTQ